MTLRRTARSAAFLFLAAILALVLGLVASGGRSALAQGTPDPDLPFISEVAPTAGTGAPAWVEITMGRANPGTVAQPFTEAYVLLPLVGGASTSSSATAASLPDSGFNLHGWHLSDMDGNTYDVPISLPFLSKGMVVLILLDGTGPAADEMDPSDGKVTLHTPADFVNVLDAGGDQLALHDPGDTLISFVAWGQAAGADDDAAAAAGKWSTETFVIYDGGFGAGQINVPPAPNASIGVWQDSLTSDAANWAAYAPANSTPGAHNPPPAPLQSTVADGAVIGVNGPVAPDSAAAAEVEGPLGFNSVQAGNIVGIAWSGMGNDFDYEFQLDDDIKFLSPQYDEMRAEPGWSGVLGAGEFFWRARIRDSRGNFSQYLGPFKLQVVDLFDLVSLGTLKLLLKSNEYKIQHKDSTMLDIGGGNGNVVGANNAGNRRYPADRRWDGEHVDANNVPRFGWNGMDNWYCVRASTAMINDFYGGNVTQDRLSYYAFEELADPWYGSPANLRGRPENDLGFAIGIGSYSIQEKVLSWALGNAAVTATNYCPPNPNDGNPYTCPNPAGSPMSFAAVKSLIDQGRPFVSVNLRNAHARVVDGYWEISPNSRWVHMIDPVPADTTNCPTCPNAQWIEYTAWTNRHERTIVGPANVPSPRTLEAGLTQDTDGDGINNFDESARFHTSPSNPDTDGDLVKDKNDLAETIFDVSAVGAYVYTPGMSPKTFDFDGDLKRKELDPDNDGDGSLDGCEDVNLDGEFDGGGAGETNNFFALGGQPCQPRFAILDPITGQAANAGDPANPDKVLIRLALAFPPAQTPQPNFTAAQFNATIGGINAPVLGGAKVGQEFWLLVQAPGQASNSFFNLAVNFVGAATGHNNQSDSENNAVYYIPRPRVNTMVIFDRSGSMADANKLASAKNAARLYIDQWATNDRIGLVTFGDTATVAKALTVIPAGGNVLTETKNLLNGVTANGATAMGPGLLAGQQQLTTNGDPTHDWTMILLTDGQENVNPQWPDPAVSGSIIPTQTVVNTVGIGAPNAIYFGRLAEIAGSTGGHFAAVDDPSVVAAAELDEVAQVEASFSSTTANLLADEYKWAAEQSLGEQRIYAATGMIPPTAPSTHRFHVGDVPSLMIVANFDKNSAGEIAVFDPTGQPVNLLLPAVKRILDTTHDQVRIGDPIPGLWSVEVKKRSGVTLPVEFALFASADTPLTLNLVAGAPIPIPTTGAAQAIIPLAAFVADDALLTTGVSVLLEMRRPDGTVATLAVFDDGAHNDGAAGDGIWGGNAALVQRGPYSFKAKATISTPGATYRYAQIVVNY